MDALPYGQNKKRMNCPEGKFMRSLELFVAREDAAFILRKLSEQFRAGSNLHRQPSLVRTHQPDRCHSRRPIEPACGNRGFETGIERTHPPSGHGHLQRAGN